jgi:hypothetical protein
MRQSLQKGIISVEKQTAVCRNCRWSLLFCGGLGRIGGKKSVPHELLVADFELLVCHPSNKYLQRDNEGLSPLFAVIQDLRNFTFITRP